MEYTEYFKTQNKKRIYMYTDSNLILTRRTLEYSVYSAIPPNRVTPKAAMLLDKINSIPF